MKAVEAWTVDQVRTHDDGFEITLVKGTAPIFGTEEEQDGDDDALRRRYLVVRDRADAQFFAVRIGGTVRLSLEWEDVNGG